MFPYRLSIDQAGNVVVLDLGAKNFLWFSQNGEFLRRSNLGISFAMVSDFTILRGDTIVVAGLADDPRAKEYALHVLAPDLSLLRSFEPVARGLSREVQRLYGVGSVTRSRWDAFYFAPKGHGDVVELNTRGVHLRTISVSNAGLTDPHAAFTVAPRSNGGMEVRAGDSLVAHGRVIALGGGAVLTSRVNGKKIQLVEHDATGTPIDSLWISAVGELPISFDSTDCTIVLQSRKAGELTLGWLPLSPANGSQVLSSTKKVASENSARIHRCRVGRSNRLK